MNFHLQGGCAAVLSVALLFANPAHAFHTSGSFSGLLTASPLPQNFPPPHPASYYNGATITGVFEVSAPAPTFHQGDGGGAYFLNGGGGFLSMRFEVLGQQFTLYQGDVDPSSGNLPSVIRLDTDMAGNTQAVRFQTDFRPRYGGGILSFSGPSGSLFDGLDPATLHLDPTDLPSISVTFADSAAGMTFGFVANQVLFDPAPPVPEPGTLPMALAGVALAAWFARRRST